MGGDAEQVDAAEVTGDGTTPDADLQVEKADDADD
jgi:hypothetical protein